MKIFKIVLILVGLIGSVLGVIGGTITIGDRLWADKSEMAAIKTKVEDVEKTIDKIDANVDYMYKIFLEAARHAPHTANESDGRN